MMPTPRACADPMTSHTHPKTPAVSGWHRVFSALDVDAFETVIAQWAQQALLAASGPSPVAIAVAGKALRGCTGRGFPEYDWSPDLRRCCGLVTRQKEGSPGQGDLTAARELTRELLPVAGNLTGHRQAEPAETLRGQAIALAFATATAAPDGSYRQAQTWQRRGGAAVGKRGGCVLPMPSMSIWTGREWGRCFGLSDRCDRIRCGMSPWGRTLVGCGRKRCRR